MFAQPGVFGSEGNKYEISGIEIQTMNLPIERSLIKYAKLLTKLELPDGCATYSSSINDLYNVVLHTNKNELKKFKLIDPNTSVGKIVDWRLFIRHLAS